MGRNISERFFVFLAKKMLSERIRQLNHSRNQIQFGGASPFVPIMRDTLTLALVEVGGTDRAGGDGEVMRGLLVKDMVCKKKNKRFLRKQMRESLSLSLL